MIIKQIFGYFNTPFSLLDERSNRLLMIVACLISSVVFVNIFVPFNINRWMSDSGFIQFLRLSSYGFVVSSVFLFTQFPLRKWFKIDHYKIKTYLFWLIIEISLISLVYIFLYGNPLGNFVNDFIFSVKYTSLGILIPYTFSLIFIYYRLKKSEIRMLQEKIRKPYKIDIVSFEDENSKVRFSTLSKKLLLIESTDNYVTVYFIDRERVKRELIRNSLKKLEEKLPSQIFMRCHRSYIINVANIEYVKREKRKVLLKVKHLDEHIPVSQKYFSTFNQIITQ